MGLERVSVGSLTNWLAYAVKASEESERRRRMEAGVATGSAFTVPGRCYVCDQAVEFAVDYRYSYEVDGVLTPNWREHLTCPGCGLNNRMRAAIQAFEEWMEPASTAAIFMGEQVTPLYRWFAAHYPGVVGCEHLGDTIPSGMQRADGVRNEDLTALTFGESEFDFALTFDVFEHIPDIGMAFSECCRVLAPGGHVFFSVPFRFDSRENLVRAVRRDDGSIEHLLPPEYHGDPLDPHGCLAFYHYGWEMVGQLVAAGFDEPQAHLYWSDAFGYLGAEQAFFTARKPTRDKVG